MLAYILRRLLIIIPTMLVIVTLSFFMMKIAPGSPFDGDRALDPIVEANLLKTYGLDKPLWQQYTDYLLNVAKGDFGPSLKNSDFTVNELVSQGIKVTAQIGILAVILSVFTGVVLGSFAAYYQNSKIDHFIMTFAMVGIVLPNYAVAPILVIIFAMHLKLLPVAGFYGAKYLILPVIALALPKIAYIARLTRGSMLEVLNSNFIRTAYSKGLDNKVVLFKHALRPAILPVISYLGPAIAAVLTGSVVIETIFDIPGLGKFFVNSAINRDYPVVMAVVILYAFLILIINLIVDVLYSLIDPKVDLQDK